MEQTPMPHLFDTFHIGSFRGFTDVELKDCGAVNLLIGPNNSGKSTVLEALALYARPFDQKEWLDIIVRRESRGRRRAPVEDLRWLFARPGMELALSSSGTAPIARLSATAKSYQSIGPDIESEERSIAVVKIQVNAYTRAEPDKMIGERLRFASDTDFPEVAPHSVDLQSLTPFSHRIEPEQVRAFTEATIGEWKSEVLELLRQIDPAILNLEILDPSGTSSTLGVKYNGLPIAPLSTLGDGLRRIISIALAIGNLKNGLLLIDEIESAVHVSALETVFPWLTAACKRNNVQLFATTHSLEALDALLATPEGNEMACYRLNRPDQPERIQRIAPDLLRRLRFNRGFDVRFSR